MRVHAELEARVEARCLKTSCGCWLWLGSIGSHGYGDMHLGGGRAHANKRFDLDSMTGRGTVPRMILEGRHGACVGLDARHKCGVRACCNPEHIEPGTRTENIMDAIKSGSWFSEKRKAQQARLVVLGTAALKRYNEAEKAKRDACQL